MPTQPEIVVFDSKTALQQAAAERIVAAAIESIADHKHFSIVLSGGSTPPGVYHMLTQEPLRDRVPWSQVSVLWGDERYVPFNDDDSNYMMARQALLDYVPIPSEQVYPVPTYYGDPQEAANVYARQVQALLDSNNGQLDLALQGLGSDGHTASLFPGFLQLDAGDDTLVVAVDDSPKPPPRRISLTVSAINRAARVIFLVTGEDKAQVVYDILRGPREPQRLPAQLIQPTHGSVTWMLDTAAASKLDDTQ